MRPETIITTKKDTLRENTSTKTYKLKIFTEDSDTLLQNVLRLEFQNALAQSFL